MTNEAYGWTALHHKSLWIFFYLLICFLFQLHIFFNHNSHSTSDNEKWWVILSWFYLLIFCPCIFFSLCLKIICFGSGSFYKCFTCFVLSHFTVILRTLSLKSKGLIKSKITQSPREKTQAHVYQSKAAKTAGVITLSL